MRDDLEQLRLSAKLKTTKFKTVNTALLKELYELMLKLEDMKTYYQKIINNYPCNIKMIECNLNRLRSYPGENQSCRGSSEEEINKIRQKLVNMSVELLSAEKKLPEISNEMEKIGAAVDDIRQVNNKIDSICNNTENFNRASIISH